VTTLFNGGNTGKPDWSVCSAVYYTCLATFDLSGLNCNKQLKPDPKRYTAERECLQTMDISHWWGPDTRLQMKRVFITWKLFV
jgi:hypothetical protein